MPLSTADSKIPAEELSEAMPFPDLDVTDEDEGCTILPILIRLGNAYRDRTAVNDTKGKTNEEEQRLRADGEDSDETLDEADPDSDSDGSGSDSEWEDDEEDGVANPTIIYDTTQIALIAQELFESIATRATSFKEDLHHELYALAKPVFRNAANAVSDFMFVPLDVTDTWQPVLDAGVALAELRLDAEEGESLPSKGTRRAVTYSVTAAKLAYDILWEVIHETVELFSAFDSHSNRKSGYILVTSLLGEFTFTNPKTKKILDAMTKSLTEFDFEHPVCTVLLAAKIRTFDRFVGTTDPPFAMAIRKCRAKFKWDADMVREARERSDDLAIRCRDASAVGFGPRESQGAIGLGFDLWRLSRHELDEWERMAHNRLVKQRNKANN